MIKLILSTDMSLHFSSLFLLQERVKSEDFNPALEDKDLVCAYLLHMADISNSSKPWKISS